MPVNRLTSPMRNSDCSGMMLATGAKSGADMYAFDGLAIERILQECAGRKPELKREFQKKVPRCTSQRGTIRVLNRTYCYIPPRRPPAGFGCGFRGNCSSRFAA